MDRPLFAYERLMLAGGRTYSLVVAARITGLADPDPLRHALDRLQARHPALNAWIVPASKTAKPDDRPRFETLRPAPPIPLTPIDRTTPERWLAVLADELDHPFPHAAPPIRALWVRPPDATPKTTPETTQSTSELILTVHHVVADGKSALAMLGFVLSCLQGLPEPPPPPVVVSPARLLGGADRPTPLAHARTIATAALAAAVLRVATIRKRRPEPPVPPTLDAWSFDADVTAALQSRARAEGVTSYVALALVLLRCFGEAFPDRAKNRLVCPVDIRDRFTLDHPELLFPSPPNVTLRRDRRLDGDIWAQARRLAADLARARARLNPARVVAVTERLHPLVDRVVETQLAARPRIDLSFSHVGEVRFPTRDASGSGTPSPVQVDRALALIGNMPWPDAMLLVGLREAGRQQIFMISNEAKLACSERQAFIARTHAMLATILAPPA